MEPEAQGRGIIVAVTRLLLLGTDKYLGTILKNRLKKAGIFMMRAIEV